MIKLKYILLIIICLLLSGCMKNYNSALPSSETNDQHVEINNEVSKQYTNSNIISNRNNVSQFNAQEQYDIIISSFIAKNPDRIKELFCDKVKNTHDLNAEISCAMQFIDGNIVSYFVDKAVSANGGAVEDGDYVDIHAAPWILDIKTDTGANYDIHFFSRLKYVDNPDEVGVQFIKIIRDNDDSYTIGEYYKGNYGA